MIEITYYRKQHRVTVKGHSGSDEEGKDLVCAAVTALCYTLALNVEQLARAKHIRRPRVKLWKGMADITCSPVHDMGAIVTVVFDSIAMGLEYIAGNNPQYARYEIK